MLNIQGITKEKTSFISESSAIISKSMSNNPVLRIKTRKLQNLIQV